MKNSAKLVENFDESLEHKSYKKNRRNKGSRKKRLGKTNFLGIDNRKTVSQTDLNSNLKPSAISVKTSDESIKKNNSKRAAISLQGVTGFDTGGIKGISKGVQHQDVISSHSVIITLTVVIPVSIVIFFMVRSFNVRRKNKWKKKKVENKNCSYKLLKDSDEKLHQPWASISSGEAEAALAVDFINMMESTSLSELTSHENDTKKYLILSDSDESQKKINKENMKGKNNTDISLNLPAISLLCYNGFFPSNSDLPLMASVTKVCSETFKSDIEFSNGLKRNTSFKTTEHKEGVDSLCDRYSLSPNPSSISNSEIFCSQISLKIQDKSLLKKDTPESKTKKISMKNNPSKIKEASDLQGEKINRTLENGDEVLVDSRMSFTTACTTLEESKSSIISEVKSSNHCSQSVKENQDDDANHEACANEVLWTPKTPLIPKIREQLKCKNKQDDQVFSESKQESSNLGGSDKLGQTSPLQINISCLAHKNEPDSNKPKSSKAFSSKPKSNLPCSKVMPKSVCTQTSGVNLQTVGLTNNYKCKKTSNAQKIYKEEGVRFLNNQNHNDKNNNNVKSRLKSISKPNMGIENYLSTRKSLETVRKNLNAISKREKKHKIRRNKIKGDNHTQFNQQLYSSIPKLKFDIIDEITLNQNGYQSKFGKNTQNKVALTKNNLLQSTKSSSVVKPEKMPVNSEDYTKFDSRNNAGLSSSLSKFACGRTPYNTEHSGLSLTSYPPLHNNSIKHKIELEKNQRITSGSSISYFKCGRTPKNTESETNKSYLSQGSESSKFYCGKTPINTEIESVQSHLSQCNITAEFDCRKTLNTENCLKNDSMGRKNSSSSYINEAFEAFANRLRKQSPSNASSETIDSAIEGTCIRHNHIEDDSHRESYTNPDYGHSPKFVLGTSVTSSCSVTSSPSDINTTDLLEGFITNDAIYDLRISPKQYTHLNTESTNGSRCYKEKLNNTEGSPKLDNTATKKLNPEISSEEIFSVKNTPSELLKQVIHKLEASETGSHNDGHVSQPTSTPKTVRFSNDNATYSLSSETIYASNSTDMSSRPLDFSDNTNDDQVCYSSYESHCSFIPVFKVYKKIQR